MEPFVKVQQHLTANDSYQNLLEEMDVTEAGTLLT